MKREIIVAAIALGIGLAIGLRPRPQTTVTVRDTVEVTRVIQGAPEVHTRFVDHVIWRSVPAETILVSRSMTDSTALLFCSNAALRSEAALTPSSDTLTTLSPPTTPPPPLLALSRGRVDSDGLYLWGFTSDMRAWYGSYNVVHRGPTAEWLTVGDSVQVSQRREIRIPPLVKDGLVFTLGIALGLVVGSR